MCRHVACVDCQQQFTSPATRGPIPKRCDQCRRAAELTRASKARQRRANAGHLRVCKHCNGQWLARHPKAKFCSRNCQYLASGGRVIVTCERCEKTFQTTLKRRKEGHRFCSRACMRQALQCGARNCVECGKEFRRNPKGDGGKNDKALFCSKPCYFAARSAGRVAWDTTNQRKASWHRGGAYASAPSVRLMRRIAKAHAVIEKAGRALLSMAGRELSRPACERCGGPCKDGASRFCSLGCLKMWRGVRQCELCGVDVPNATAYCKCRCRDCRALAKTKANRKQKQKYGRNHRQRARHHGVRYVSVEVRAIYERDGWRCQICKRKCKRSFVVNKADGRPHPRSPTIDHIKSMKNGGHHEPSNLQLACFECNTKKGAASRGQLRLALA